MRIALRPHPDTPSRAVRAVEVEVGRAEPPHNLWLRYVIRGDISRLAIPKRKSNERANDLWRHTCLEAFFRQPGSDAYCELNFSPSTEWAAYRFDSYRQGMVDALLVTHWIDVDHGDDWFELSAHLMAPTLSTPSLFALTAVIEEIDGVKSYWALKHPPGKPDFHHADGFVLELP
jgi:hypothetical protein